MDSENRKSWFEEVPFAGYVLDLLNIQNEHEQYLAHSKQMNLVEFYSHLTPQTSYSLISEGLVFGAILRHIRGKPQKKNIRL